MREVEGINASSVSFNPFTTSDPQTFLLPLRGGKRGCSKREEKMKLPKKLKIAGHIYTVIYPYTFTEVSLQGQSDLIQKEIRLGKVDTGGNLVPQAQLNNTLCHEILHCIDYEYNNQKLDDNMIDRLGNGLYQVLRDNKLNLGG